MSSTYRVCMENAILVSASTNEWQLTLATLEQAELEKDRITTNIDLFRLTYCFNLTQGLPHKRNHINNFLHRHRLKGPKLIAQQVN